MAPSAPTADLRAFCLPPRDQGQEGCCSGFATAALREVSLAVLKGSLTYPALAPAYLYARTRMTEGTFPQDSGATIVDEVNTLENYGACPESVLPYTQNPAEAPTPAADVAAVPFRSGTPAQLDFSTPSSIEAVLAQKQAVVFGMSVYQSFEQTGTDGLVPVPDTDHEACLGGHAMLIVGYDRSKQLFTVRNSWGTSWGDNGYCYLPYRMLDQFMEAWTIPLT